MSNISGMKMISEFSGTFILAGSIIYMTVYDQGSQSNSLFAILAGFFVAVTLTREISGGHLNPGVTFAIYFAEQDRREKGEKANQLWMYIVSQLAGALSAVFFGWIIYDDNSFKMAPHEGSHASEAFAMEVFGSFVFYLIILVQGDKDAKLYNDKTVSTIVVVAGLCAGIAMSGNVSGGCLNPALGFAFNLGRLLATAKIDEVRYLWVYLLGPILGAFTAAYFYHNLFRRYFELENSDEKKTKLIPLEEF